MKRNSEMEEILSVRNLSKYYTSGRSVVVGLSQITLSFSLGEFVAITGESGSGKTTLAHILSGILHYESGELFFNGKPTSHYDNVDWEHYRRDCVSFISQSYGILPGSTVLSNVVSALRLAGIPRENAHSEAEAILRRVELWELRGRRAAKLSSGQKQRLSIARALAKPSPILIADEPTGNLDPENSAKIINLLAEAAKDRLVILITHEFSEAESSATRHICIHDGHITMDAKLRDKNEPKRKNIGPLISKKHSCLSAYVATLQLGSRPVWSCLMLLFFTLTVFAVFAFAGTFISSLDDTPTRLYDDSAFPNGDNRRIVVCRPDGLDMTAEDETALLSVDYVESIERYGYLSDIHYAYREGTDFQWRYSLENTGNSVDSKYEQVSAVTLNPSKMFFAKTIPVFSDERNFLTGGRFPENAYEVIAAGGEELLGQTFPVYFQDSKNWNRSAYLYFEVTVVGVTDYGSGLYFHDDIGRVFLAETLLYKFVAENGYFYYIYFPSSELMGNEARMEKTLFNRSLSNYGNNFTFFVPFLDDIKNYESGIELTFSGYHMSTANMFLEVSLENFRALTHAGNGDQISITMEDYAYTDRVLAKIYDLGYAAVSPYREGSTIQDSALAQQRMQTLRICAVALLIVFVLQVAVFRAMFGFEMESYRLLSNIGLDCKTAQLSVFLQVLLFTAFGQILGVSAILLCGEFGFQSIGRLLRYLSLSYQVILSLLHLSACLITAFWAMHALKRQVYPKSGSVSDLDWDALDEEVTV